MTDLTTAARLALATLTDSRIGEGPYMEGVEIYEDFHKAAEAIRAALPAPAVPARQFTPTDEAIDALCAAMAAPPSKAPAGLVTESYNERWTGADEDGDPIREVGPMTCQPVGEPRQESVEDGPVGVVLIRVKNGMGTKRAELHAEHKDLPNGTQLYTRPSPAREPLTDAAQAVLAERARQVNVEGWTPEHDDEHSNGGMAIAAACYALCAQREALEVQTLNLGTLWTWTGWASSWFKPKGPRQNLVRAGALILAEIERLDRAAAAAGEAK